MTTHDYSYPVYAKILHASLAIVGIAAFLTAELAEDGSASSGYWLHAYLGLSVTVFVFLRAIGGIAGSGCMRFSGWSPLSAQQWRLALQDMRGLARLEVPQRGMHQGLAGLTQAFGLALFAWMGLSGTVLFLIGNGAETRLFEAVEEMHEVGETLIPLYLALHVGSVVLHSVAGHPIWQRMWKFTAYNDPHQSEKTATGNTDRVQMPE